MKGEGLQGGGWGQDVTASFPHLSGNLRGIGVLRHNKTLECLHKEADSAECSLLRRCPLAQPGVPGTALCPISAGATRARRLLVSTLPCVCPTRRRDGERFLAGAVQLLGGRG